MVEGVALNCLKYDEKDGGVVTRTSDAAIRAFAQPDMVQTFVEGVSGAYLEAEESLLSQ